MTVQPPALVKTLLLLLLLFLLPWQGSWRNKDQRHQRRYCRLVLAAAAAAGRCLPHVS
jgi:hypothetical protein